VKITIASFENIFQERYQIDNPFTVTLQKEMVIVTLL